MVFLILFIIVFLNFAASKGSIVFISSAGLFRYPPGDALSVAPKATIEHLIKGIAKEEELMA